MKVQNSTKFVKEQQPQEKPVFPTNCDFMRDLQPSQVSTDKHEQNGDDYHEIYHTLSSGVYENSGGYDVESEDSQKQNEATSQQIQRNVYNHVQVKSETLINQQEPLQNKVKYEKVESQQEISNKKVLIANKNNIQLKQQYKINAKATNQLKQQKATINIYPNLYNSQEESHIYQKQSIKRSSQKPPRSMLNQQYQQYQLNQSIEHSVYQANDNSYPAFKDEEQLHHHNTQKQADLDYEVLEEQTQPYISNNRKWKVGQQKHNEKIKINIVGYQQEYFLKIETQLFQIQVQKVEKSYSIKRRFTDCANLEKLIRHHYFGYILYPFPQKSLEFFTKLKLSIGTEQQKIVLIEKRLFELQKYLNFLLSHQQISKSIVLQIFLEQSSQNFQKEMNNLLHISLEQQKQLQLGVIEQNYNSIKKIVKSSFNFINTYLNSSQQNNLELKLKQIQQQTNKNSTIFLKINQQLLQCTNKIQIFTNKIERIAAIYKSNSQISNIQSNIDSVLKLSSKLSSSRSFYEKLVDWIDNHLIYSIKYYTLLLRKINESIEHRAQLITKINTLPIQKIELASKIQEKVQLYDQRFIKDWTNTLQQIHHNLVVLYEKFNAEWRSHCKLMTKIWK